MIFSNYLKNQLAEFNNLEEAFDWILECADKKEDAINLASSLNYHKNKLIDLVETYFSIGVEGGGLGDEDFDEYYDEDDDFLDDDEDNWDDELCENVKRVMIVRGNKVINKKRCTKDGYKLVDGKERRMSISELIARRKAQKKAAIKRKMRQSSIMKKREISLNNRPE